MTDDVAPKSSFWKVVLLTLLACIIMAIIVFLLG